MLDELFMGKNGFYWWFGRVEDNGDPLGLGRCRVRIVGWHNPDETELPTAGLQWAYPITPITNAAIGGIGHAPVGPQINTRVFGFFMDGKAGQQPVMLGTVPGDTNTSTLNALPYGATPQQPNTNRLLGDAPLAREGDCPDGYDTDNASTNREIPDPRKITINKGEWQIPVTGFVSSAYGERGQAHHGVDIATAGFFAQTSAGASHLNGRLRGPVGNPVYAAAAGEVIYAWTNDKGQRGAKTTYDINGQGSRSYGNAIAIRHKLSTGTFTTIYAHLGSLQDAANELPHGGVSVNVGDTVQKGQQIGTVGRTHNRDTLTHLHFECRIGDGLPKANNHFNPARIFPQLAHRHWPFLSWANSQTTYNIEKLPFNKKDAPCIAGDGPK